MAPVERRTVDELIALYQLEPTIRDVFVEGSSDRALLEWYLGARSTQPVSVWEIECVDIPAETVAHYEMDIGNRGRAISLACELAKHLGPAAEISVVVVVDADFDRILGRRLSYPTLVFTDYSCVEMYLFNEAVVRKFLTIVTMGCTCPVSSVLRELEKVLQRLYVIRLANQALGWNMTWLSCERTCKPKGNTIVFDEEEFLHRYLTKNGRRSRLIEFTRKTAELSRRLLPDARHQINGHDFISLFRWMIRPMVGERKILANASAFERALFACLELGALGKEKLFVELARRFGSAL